jgi:hypothetical protein
VRTISARLSPACCATAARTQCPFRKYDVRRPESEGGAFETRYWSPLNAPVLGPDGEVAYIIHRVEDVTEFVALKEAGRQREKLAHVLEARAEQMEAEVYRRA